jgi:small subunit ribosomal protein S7
MAAMKIFDMFDVSEVKTEDPGLRRYVDLSPKMLPKNRGRKRARFSKAEISILERLINLMCVPGHRGKKHRIMTNNATGKWSKNAEVLIEALKIVEEKTKKNPVQVLIKAIENAAPRDEITTIEYGGAKYPQAVDVSPMRRVNIALRNLVHGAQDKAFGKKSTLASALAAEIAGSSGESTESFAYAKRVETEKMADSAR